MQGMKKWLPSILIMLVIFILSATPGKIINDAGLGRESLHIDGHFVMYLLLCAAYFKATKNIVLSIVLSAIFGVTDEFHQLFTPGRSSSWFDVGVDTVGASIAGIILWKLQPILPKKLKNWLLS
jgi:VanZ family protein